MASLLIRIIRKREREPSSEKNKSLYEDMSKTSHLNRMNMPRNLLVFGKAFEGGCTVRDFFRDVSLVSPHCNRILN
jgi:hypothetical protein